MAIRALVVLGLAVLASSCGDGNDQADRDRGQAASVVRQLQRSFAERDWKGVCDRMTRSAREQAGQVAHGKPERCPKDLREAFGVIDAGGGIAHARETDVVRAQVDGNHATATVAREGWSSDVPLAKEDGRWKLDSFFGTPPDAARRSAAATRTRPFPPPSESPARAFSVGDSPCAGFFADGFPEIVGDCELSARGAKVSLKIMTAFGDFKFGDCIVDYRAYIDATGRAWTASFTADSKVNNGCADVKACSDQQGSELPWKGRIGSDGQGAFRHEMRACFDTCIGFYVGTLAMKLVPDGDRWRAEAADASVGTSGLRFDGPLAIEQPNFDLRAASALPG